MCVDGEPVHAMNGLCIEWAVALPEFVLSKEDAIAIGLFTFCIFTNDVYTLCIFSCEAL